MMRRNTIQKRLTLEAVKKLRNHPTADEVYENIKLTYPDISRTTVYRNLNLLAEAGFINRISAGKPADRFDHIPAPHYHLRCRKCGGLDDIKADYMKEIDEKIQSVTGLKIENHEIVFGGICSKCNKN